MRHILSTVLLLTALMVSFPVRATSAPAWPTNLRQALEMWNKDGATAYAAAGIDVLLVPQGARLNGFSKVMLGQIDIRLSKRFRDRAQSTMKTTSINTKALVAEAESALRGELARQLLFSGYELVDASGEDVARIDVGVVDLWLAATEESDNRGASSVTISVGHMALAVTVSDTVSGATVLHAFDIEDGPIEDVHGNRMSPVCREWERQTFARWAFALRRGLDLSNGKGGEPN